MNMEMEVAMEKKRVFSLVLAILGTTLLWLPIVFMVITAIIGSIGAQRFMCDYMIPAEVGFLVIGGAAALLWAAIRERKFIKPVVWIIGITVVLILGCTGLAAASGLASGRVQETDVPGVLLVVQAALIGYDVAVAAMGVVGILMIKEFAKK
jgi:hypothetical protein